MRLAAAAIHTCGECGSGILLPRPDPADLVRLHSSDDYFDHPYFQVRRELTAELGRTYERRLVHIEQLIGRLAGRRILDIGCDTGLFLQFAQERRGMSGVGIDVFARVVARGREAGLDLRQGTLEEIGFADNSFDVACGYDLVEHVADPAGFMREVQRVLKPGGLAVFETPNYAGLVYRLGRVLAALRPIEPLLRPYQERLWPAFHVQYFTAGSLERLLRAAGLQPVAIAGRELAASELAISSSGLRALVIGMFAAAGALGSHTLLTATAVKPASGRPSSDASAENRSA